MKKSGITDGFTLLEVMVALAILSIALVSILGLQARCIDLEAEVRMRITAICLANQLMAETEMAKDPSAGEKKGDFGEQYPEFIWEKEVYPMPLPGLLEVHIIVHTKDEIFPVKIELVQVFITI